jgi:hypothetical protein
MRTILESQVTFVMVLLSGYGVPSAQKAALTPTVLASASESRHLYFIGVELRDPERMVAKLPRKFATEPEFPATLVEAKRCQFRRKSRNVRPNNLIVIQLAWDGDPSRRRSAMKAQ